MRSTLLISERARAAVWSPSADRCGAPRRLPRGDDQVRVPGGHELGRGQCEMARLPEGVRRLRRRARGGVRAGGHRPARGRQGHHPQRPQDRSHRAQRPDDVRARGRVRLVSGVSAIAWRLRGHGEGPAQALLVPGGLRRLRLPLHRQGAGAGLPCLPGLARGAAEVTERYDPSEIEPRWQALWERERTWEVANEAEGDHYYVLEMLANEQVIDGRCERCGTPVEVRQLEQWFFRITDYADRLLEDLDTIDWPAHVKTMQRNWIGRSEGAEVVFRCEELGIDYPVFTTRPDTLFGATFFVMAPEHPDVFKLSDAPEVHEYVNRAISESADERGAEHREKTGVPLGRTVTNPVNGEEIPMFVA